MARTFKALHGDDVVNTRTLLHEAIPITGTISSGTYIELGEHAGSGTDLNVKTFSHGMFESVYDYPFLSSSANHIYDLTFGLSSEQSQSAPNEHTQQAKKLNIYNQMAQTLMGYDVSGNIKNFYANGSEGTDNIGGDDAGSTPRPWYMATGTEETTGRMDEVFFMNFSRLLVKDEIKKNSFRLQLFNSGSVSGTGAGRAASIGPDATAATCTITALSKTAGQANTRVLTVSDAEGNSVNFSIDNSTSTSTATVI